RSPVASAMNISCARRDRVDSWRARASRPPAGMYVSWSHARTPVAWWRSEILVTSSRSSATADGSVSTLGRLPGVDIEALQRSADLASLVIERRLRQAVTGPDLGPRLHRDPLAGGLPQQVDREVRVDEDVARPVEDAADAVAEIGGRGHPLQRCR